MSEEAVASRRKAKGSAHRFLTEDGEFVVSGNILYNDLLRLDSSVPAIRDMFQIIFDYNGQVKKSYISKFLDRNHLSMRSVVAVHSHEAAPTSINLLGGYIGSARDFGVPPENMLDIDLSSVYSDARFVLHAGAKGRCALLLFYLIIFILSFS